MLALHEWGEVGSPRVVCLHGVRNHGRHFAPLAAVLGEYHVLAPDLLGHGHSPWEPPWDIDTHCKAIVETVGAREAVLVGHSFGGRLAFELAARAPKLVPKLVLLDPAILIPPHVALAAAENARIDKSYVSFEELIERRFDESQLHSAPRELVVEDLASHVEVDEDGRIRYRYCQSAVVAAYGEMASPAASLRGRPRADAARAAASARTSRTTTCSPAHRAALGDLLEVAVVPGGHTVLWDAFDQTAAAIAAFISG